MQKLCFYFLLHLWVPSRYRCSTLDLCDTGAAGRRIAEVKGSNPVQAWVFSGFLFATAKVAYITAMIFLSFPSYNTKLSRITSFQRIHSKKTKEDGALFRNFCPLDRVSPQMRYEADFLFHNGDYIRSSSAFIRSGDTLICWLFCRLELDSHSLRITVIKWFFKILI